jgi:hypothetical protein
VRDAVRDRRALPALAVNLARVANAAARSDLHALALVALALWHWLPLGLERTPMEGDRAYVTYFGQAVLRGESIYAVDFMGYPPIGPLLSAAAMALGRLVDLPTYLAPRYAALGVALLCVVCVHSVTRRATASAWAGVAAGVMMVGFERWAWSSFATLEPKHLLVLVSLAASLALQAGRAGLAGAAGALAVGCYHPSAVVVVPALAAAPGSQPPAIPGWGDARGRCLYWVSAGSSGACGRSAPRSTSTCCCPSSPSTAAGCCAGPSSGPHACRSRSGRSPAGCCCSRSHG